MAKSKKKRLQGRLKKLRKKIPRLRKGSAKRKRKKSLLKRTAAALRRLNKKLRERAHLVPGPPGWAGSKRIVKREVIPVVKRHRIAATSAKRWATFGNPSSDHFMGNLYSFAKDFATANNHSLADEIGRNLSIGNVVDYRSYYIKRWGRTYRVQIIAATHGTGPHLHVGVRRA